MQLGSTTSEMPKEQERKVELPTAVIPIAIAVIPIRSCDSAQILHDHNHTQLYSITI